jgi:hypothetical protein
MKMQIVWRDFGSGYYRWVASCPSVPAMCGVMGLSLPGVIKAMGLEFQKHSCVVKT